MNSRFLCNLLAFAVIASGQVFAQNQVIMKVNGNPVSKREFENIYKKNNKDPKVDQASLDEYMELFVKFKLKVTEAEELGLDTVPKFVRELKGYREQLARPYLIDEKMNEGFINEAYDRLKWEVRASHVLVMCKDGSSPSDTMKAFKKIQTLRNEIVKTGDFAAVASGENGSEDPSVKDNKGDLGWFTGFKMVYPFETAVYSLGLNEVSQPVRTKFGYHIVKLTGKRKARGKMLAAHIMIRPPEGEVKDGSKAKIDEIYQLLEQGDSFEELAEKYSDDKVSGRKGGKLNWFSVGDMDPVFDEAVFALAADGAYTKPFKTRFGWHIAKRLEKKPLGTLDEAKGTIKQRIAKDSRSVMLQQSFVQSLKKEYNFKVDRDKLNNLIHLVDESFLTGSWTKEIVLNKVKGELFSFADQSVSVDEFAQHLAAMQGRLRGPKKNPEEMTMDVFNKFADGKVMHYEKSNLENKYPKFKDLMKEYRDGILLFELTDKKVWTKATIDSSGLASFYSSNTNKFQWPERMNADVYTCKDKSISKLVFKSLKKGSEAPDKLQARINEKSQLNVELESDTLVVEDHEVLSKNKFKLGLNSPVKLDNGQYVIVNVKEIIKPSVKKLDEARGLVIAGYQEELESKWIDSLRNKFPVEINKEVLYSIQ